MPVRPTHRRPDAPAAGAVRATGIACVLATAAFLLLHALTLATAPGAAARTLQATLPALTDLDQALAAHAEDIAATAAGGTQSVPVPGLPLAVEVPRAAAVQGGSDLRRAALDTMVRRVYADGHRALRAADAPPEGPLGLFSSQWAVRRALDTMTAGNHQRIALLRSVVGAGALILIGLLAVQVDAERRSLAVGSALAAAGVTAAAAALLGRLGTWLFTTGDSDLASAVLARVAHDITATAVLVAAVAVVAGAIIAATGVVRLRATGSAATADVRRAHEGRADLARRPWEEL